MEGFAWMLGAGVILTGVGSVILATVSLRNPIELGSRFNPMSRKPDEIENVRRLKRAAKREAWRRAGTFLLATGLLLHAVHVALLSGLDRMDWLTAGISVAILSGFAVRLWQTVRKTVVEGAGSWTIGGWGP